MVEEEKTKMKNRPCMIQALGRQPKVGCCPHTIDQLQVAQPQEQDEDSGGGQGEEDKEDDKAIQFLEYQMVWALCRFDTINLVQTVAQDWRQIESAMALDLIIIPAITELGWGGES